MEDFIILGSIVGSIVVLILFVSLVLKVSEIVTLIKEVRKYQKFLALNAGYDTFINLTSADGKFLQDSERIKKWEALKKEQKTQI